jgi:hypothetical protein
MGNKYLKSEKELLKFFGWSSKPEKIENIENIEEVIFGIWKDGKQTPYILRIEGGDKIMRCSSDWGGGNEFTRFLYAPLLFLYSSAMLIPTRDKREIKVSTLEDLQKPFKDCSPKYSDFEETDGISLIGSANNNLSPIRVDNRILEIECDSGQYTDNDILKIWDVKNLYKISRS